MFCPCPNSLIDLNSKAMQDFIWQRNIQDRLALCCGKGKADCFSLDLQRVWVANGTERWEDKVCHRMEGEHPMIVVDRTASWLETLAH